MSAWKYSASINKLGDFSSLLKTTSRSLAVDSKPDNSLWCAPRKRLRGRIKGPEDSAFQNSPIAVRFAFEWHDNTGTWHRFYGNETWEFDELGLMRVCLASINDLAIDERDRKFR